MTSDSSFIFKGSAIIIIGTSLDLVLSFIGQVITIRYLSPDEYGIVSLGITILTMTVVGVSLGLKNGVARFIPTANSSDRKRDIIRSSLELVFLSSSIIGIILFLSADILSPLIFDGSSGTQILRLVAVTIPFAVALRVGVGIIQGLKQTVPRVLFHDLSLPITRIGFIIVVIVLGYGAVATTAAYLGAYVIAGTLAVSYVFHASPSQLSLRKDHFHSELISFSLPLFVSAAMWQVFSSFDIILLGYFSNSESVGIYNSIYSLSGLILAVVTAFGYTFLPLISEAYSNENISRMENLYSVVIKWLLIFTVVLSIPLILFSKILTSTLFGVEYAEGHILLPILITGFLLYSVAGLPSRVLKAIGQTKLIMYNSLFVAILNIVLNIFLIPRFDLIGAAVSTSIAFIVLSYLLFYQSYHYTEIDPLPNSVLFIAISGFVVSFGIYRIITSFFVSSIGTAVAVMLCFIPVYIVIILRIDGLSEDEKNAVQILCEETNIPTDLVLKILQKISR